MFKALVMLKRNGEDVDQERPLLDPGELELYGRRQVEALVEAAVNFCNDGSRGRRFKELMTKVCVPHPFSISHSTVC